MSCCNKASERKSIEPKLIEPKGTEATAPDRAAKVGCGCNGPVVVTPKTIEPAKPNCCSSC